MKTRKLFFGFVLILALFLAACSPQIESTSSMSNMDLESANTTEIVEGKDGDMLVEEDNGSMADDQSDMSDHDGDDMVEEKDDDVMDGDKEDDMIADKESDMVDHSDDSIKEIKDDVMSENKDGDVSDSSIMTPSWFKTSLIDVNTGDSFTVADFKGKIVLVETLAMWCSNCLKQQGQVQSLHDLLGERDDFVSVGIDIDPNENADALKSYTINNGFDWLYTVASAEIAREIGQLYGDQFLNPPSTPMLIIDQEGVVHLLPFGIKSAEELREALKPFLDAEMK